MGRGRPLLLRLLAARILVALPVGAQWPDCQEQRVVFRHNGKNGIFVDLVSVGAKEGCWQNDCTKSDKYVCPSPAECAEACGRIEVCKFWTYEHPTRKCFLRSLDAGREEHPDFVSGARECLPPQGSGSAKAAVRVAVPFAKAAIWAAELPALRACDGGIGSPGCDNPYVAMNTWRYAVNNLRLAVNGLPEAERQRHGSTLQYVQQISQDVATFYRQPTAESFQVAVTNLAAIFNALGGWLHGAPPVELEVPAEDPSRHSASLPSLAASAGASPASVRAKLADGREMPLLGFGTWQMVGQEVYDATIAALRVGYRHIDTAQAYMNEREVGLGIRDSGVPREEIFIATKISDPGEFPQLEQRLDAQLAALGTNYLDLYMLHSPGDKAGREQAWRTMEAMLERGKVRSLGVSNFGAGEMQELLEFARIKPVYVQNKFSVYNPGEQQLGPVPLIPFAREQGMQVMGYSVINPWPFMLPPMEDPHVKAVAARCGRSPAQVLHRWALQQGVAVIPKSATPARIQENAQLFDFELSAADVRLLDGIVTLSETVAGSLSPAWAGDVYGLGASAV